jgi:hypothetical protein
MRQTTIRSFNLDWEVAHALRYKKKNQSAYVNRVLREKLITKDAPLALGEASELVLTCFLRDQVNDEFLKKILQRHADNLISSKSDE